MEERVEEEVEMEGGEEEEGERMGKDRTRFRNRFVLPANFIFFFWRFFFLDF